jgi:hypothetical protein
MRHSPLLSLFSFCVGLLAAGTVHAADVAVFAPETNNVSAADASAVGELIAQSYALVSHQSVVAPTQSTAALTAPDAYQAAAAQLGVREYIRLNVVAAGPSLAISAGRYRADGQVLQQVKQVAASVEDVAVIADGLARALLTGSVPAAEVAAAPVRPPPPPPKVEAEDNMVYGFKAGLHFPLARDALYYPTVSLQFVGRLQLTRTFLEFGAGFVLPTVIENEPYVSCPFDSTTMTSVCPPNTSRRGHTGGITAEIGASYYLSDTNVSPYIGGGLITRIILAGLDDNYETEDPTERNIASILAYGQFGLTYPRHNTTRLFADLRVAQSLLSQRLENGRSVWPVEPTVHVGFGW